MPVLSYEQAIHHYSRQQQEYHLTPSQLLSIRYDRNELDQTRQ